MSITFHQLVTPWNGTTPAASGLFTPNSSGDALLAVIIDLSAADETLSMTGTSTYAFPEPTVCGWNSGSTIGQQNPNNFTDVYGSTGALGFSLSCVGGAQTASATSSGSGDNVMGLILDYSGVGFVNSGYSLANIPSSLAGPTIGVPTGSVLVAICLCVSTNAALTNSNGTSRGSGIWNGQAYSISEFVGANAAVTPGWTQVGAPYTSNSYDYFYFLMTPLGGIEPIYVVQSPLGPENAGPWTCALTGTVPVGDVIIAILAGGGGGSSPNPFPLTVNDSVNSGNYTQVYEFYHAGYGFYGAIYYKIVNTSGTPTVTINSSNLSTAFLGLVQVSGFGSNTPTIDTGASVEASGNSATQGGTVSSGFPNEILLNGPWNLSFLEAPIAGWTYCDGTGDSTYYSVLLAPQANNFAGTLSGGATEWLSVIAGIYSAAPAVAAAIVAWLT